jgi:hypothetical protein
MKTNLFSKLIAGLLLLSTITIAQSQEIRYVRQNGTGNGSSWASASNDIQAMINDLRYAEDGQVWIAAGTYVPNTKIADVDQSGQPTTDRDKAFMVKFNISLYGGFPPSGNPTMNERNWRNYKSILDGKANDLSHPLGMLGGAFHVLIACQNDSITIDGLHITGGKANQFGEVMSIPRSEGGGVYINCLSKITNCEIYGNNAIKGGGIKISTTWSEIVTQNNRIYDNTAINGGGGIHVHLSSSNMHFANNLLFANRSIDLAHDAYFELQSAELLLTNNTIHHYHFHEGMYNPSNYFEFRKDMLGDSRIYLRNSIFLNEEPMGTTLSFHRLSADAQGVVEISRCLTDRDIQEEYWIMLDHIIINDPGFLGPGQEDYHLSSNSRCVDVGNNDYVVVPVDLDGKTRIFNEMVDIGAFEYHAGPFTGGNRLYVGYFPGGDESGSNWRNACPSFSRALSIAKNNAEIEEIWVQSGYYYPEFKIVDVDMEGNPATLKDHAFLLPKNVKIYGGFFGHEERLEQRNYYKRETVLLGFSSNINPIDTLYHVVIAAGDLETACLDGFTIVNGSAIGEGAISINGENIERTYGGGICMVNSSLMLNNIIIKECNAIYGGAISSYQMSPMLTNLSIYDNAANFGGGLYNDGSSVIMTNLTITGNSAKQGSGIYNVDCPTPVIRNIVVWENNDLDGNLDNIINFNTSPEYLYSLIQGVNPEGEGNLDGEDENNNPLFVDPTEKDFHLGAGCPALNNGNPDYFSPGLSPDLSDIRDDIAGNLRIINGKVDMGAYQNLFSDITVSDIYVDGMKIFPVDWVGTLYQVTLPRLYRDELLIEAVPRHPGATVEGDCGIQPAVVGLNVYNLKVISEDKLCEEWYRVEVTLEDDGSIASEKKELFRCYPNPVSDNLYISSESEIEYLILYNYLGQKMKEQPFNGQYIDMHNLASGVYFLKGITRDGKTGTVKIVKK